MVYDITDGIPNSPQIQLVKQYQEQIRNAAKGSKMRVLDSAVRMFYIDYRLYTQTGWRLTRLGHDLLVDNYDHYTIKITNYAGRNRIALARKMSGPYFLEVDGHFKTNATTVWKLTAFQKKDVARLKLCGGDVTTWIGAKR